MLCSCEGDNGVLGRTIHYSDADFPGETDATQSAHRTVPDAWPGTNRWLDSCGAFVYSSAMLWYNPPSWTLSNLIAITLAHEIGHAIGLDHITYRANVMRPLNTSMPWDSMARFIWNDKDTRKANLRRLLGRESIDILW
jgi:hypothetical protein